MVKAKRKSVRIESDEQFISSEERLARVMALSAVKDLSSGEQVSFMRSSGFSVADTARLLMISENQVSVSMVQIRKVLSKGINPTYLAIKKNA